MNSNPRDTAGSLKALWKCEGLLVSDRCSYICSEPCLLCSSCGGAAGNRDQWVNPARPAPPFHEDSGCPGSAAPQGVLSQGLHPKAQPTSQERGLSQTPRSAGPWQGQGWGRMFSPSSRKQIFSFPVLLNVGSFSPCAFSAPARREVNPLCILQQGSRAGLPGAGAGA